MKKKRNLMDKFIIMLLPIIMAAVILPAIKTKAAYAADADAIGKYEEIEGKSITGVRISKNGNTVCYALDTWEKGKDGEWGYIGSNIDNSIGEITSCLNSPVYIKDTTGTRFGINIGKIKEYLPEKGSIVIEKYVYGKCTYNRAEFTYQDSKNNRVDISKSILKHIENGISGMDLEDTIYEYNGASYIYNIYDAAVISRNGDIKADIPYDCTILSEGYAYYGIEGEYLIREFPQIEHDPEDGCTFTFKGWYTSPSGGNEISIGDAIEPGTTIYPQWEKTLNIYNVNCIDILGDNPGGQVLSKNSWTAQYNIEVNGAELGSDSAAGVYYKGLCYTGSTSATIKGDCDIYRYFRPVSYNIIFNGNNAVSGETSPLYGCLYGEKYKLTENGYKRNVNVILDLNAEDAICTINNINVPYKFTGWSDTADGGVIYADGIEVSDLCETDGEKQLYAVWEGSTVKIEEVPIREGYNFNGWSKDKDSTTGSTSFEIRDIDNNCTLYAIWKPLKAKYSVEYYLENSKKGYTLDKKTEYEAFTGYEADCSNDVYITEHSNKYILDKDKSIYKGMVKYDGSLLLKCYLKKKTTDNGNTGNNTGNGGNTGNAGENTTGSGTGNSGNTGSTSGNTTGSNTGNSGNTGSAGGNTTGSGTGNSGNTGSTSGNTTGSNTGNSGNTGSAGENATGSSTGNSGSTGTNTGSNIANGNHGVISGGSIGNSGNLNNSNGNTGSNNSAGGSGVTAGSGSISAGGNNSTGVTGNVSGSQSGNAGSNNAVHNGTNAGNTTQGAVSGGSDGNVSGGDITGSSTGITGTGEDDEGGNGEDSIVNNGKDYTDGNGENGNTMVKKSSPKKKKLSYLKAGKKYIKSGIVYKIIKSNSKTRTVKAIKAKKSIGRAEIPSVIKIKGYKYKVVSIGKKAFVKCKKLKKVIIGKNIKSIGRKAFYKDRKLGSIRIKSKKLKTIGKRAFKRIKPGCVVKIAGNRKYAKKVFSMISAKN